MLKALVLGLFALNSGLCLAVSVPSVDNHGMNIFESRACILNGCKFSMVDVSYVWW